METGQILDNPSPTMVKSLQMVVRLPMTHQTIRRPMWMEDRSVRDRIRVENRYWVVSNR